MSLLEVENLTKTYRIGDIDIHALQGVSLKIEEGGEGLRGDRRTQYQ